MKVAKHNKIGIPRGDTKAYMSAWRIANLEKKHLADREYHSKNRLIINARSKKWREENPERFKERRDAWYLKTKDNPVFKEKQRKQRAEWVKQNPGKAYQQYKKSYDIRRRENPNVAVALRLRNHVRKSLNRQSAFKESHLNEILGISVPEFRKVFFSKFQRGMTVEDFMSGKIHIDHIIPVSSFDLTNPTEQKRAFHYTNLQPLWASENIMKGSKLISI